MSDAERWERPKGRCKVCGKILGAQAHFIVDGGPDGEHVTCRDWSAYPFHYEAILSDLRRRYRQIERAADVDLLRDVVELGRWLASRKRLWPKEAVETVNGLPRVDSVLARLKERGVTIRR